MKNKLTFRIPKKGEPTDLELELKRRRQALEIRQIQAREDLGTDYILHPAKPPARWGTKQGENNHD